MRIAVASKSGTEVDQHFGHAERFLIYDFARGESTLVQEVAVERYCSFDPDHPFRHRQFDAIVAALAGCKAVVTAQIGELPAQELKQQGIVPISAVGPIPQALRTAHDQVCGCACRNKGPCKQV